ncbi:MAG: tyrosine/phenylalanine carboxypeptidase domain-containing protein [bacterium]
MKLSEITSQLHSLKSHINATYLLTPQNLKIEKSNFLANKIVNPQLIYPEIPQEILTTKFVQTKELLKQNFSEEITEKIIFNKLKELELKLIMLLARDNQEYSNISLKLYQCDYDTKTLNQAKQDAKISADFSAKDTATPEKARQIINQYFLDNQIPNWHAEISDLHDFYFRIQAAENVILISREVNWDFCDLDCVMAHEIDGHIFRAINMKNQNDPLFSKPLPFYIKTEEGLASFLGDYLSTTSLVSRKHHALKYLAGKLAQTSSFREVFEFFCDHGFTKELAFRRTFRLKRGISDTSLPGVYGHEAMYYEGMLEVKNYLENGGDLKALYAGKAGIDDLSNVPISKEIMIPQRLIKRENKY